MYDNWETGSYFRSHNHDYNARNHNSLVPSAARLTVTQNSISAVGPNIWNSIPLEIRLSPSRNIFKNRLKAHFLLDYL